jgi:uncharacterized protein YciI
MWYCILAHINPTPEIMAKRGQFRTQHLARLQALQDQGRLLVAGPLPAIDSEEPGAAGVVGSLIVAEFSSLAAAKTWADTDPYQNGVYHKVDIYPFKRVLPA